MPKEFNISRRKALAALGTIGVASAGAGVGTTAYFSDTESFANNELTAGQLDLAVKADIYEYQGSANDPADGGTRKFGGTQNGQSPTIKQELTDVKPGDYSWGSFCFSIVDNPGYIWAGGELTANDENSVTEPEADDDPNNSTVDPDGDIDGSGELADAIEVTLFYADPNFDPSVQGRPSSSSFSGTNFKGVIFEGSLKEALAYLQTGVPLDADPDDGEDDRDAFTGTSSQNFDDDCCLGFAWEVPTSVGNEIQTDSVNFDLSFVAQQERHNDGSQQPFADESYSADYVNPDDIDNPIEDGVLKLDVSYGTTHVFYSINFDEPDGSTYSLADPTFASTSASIAFNADSEDDDIYDFQVGWDPDAGLPDDPFGYSAVDESVPEWEKDTSAGWSALPPGFFAAKSGEIIVVGVPRSALDKGSTDEYKFGVLASAGGEQPFVNIPTSGVYSGDDNSTSDNANDLTTTLQ
jgi:predicted ribosomally synthesized peptide with SipW-like signal peptide